MNINKSQLGLGKISSPTLNILSSRKWRWVFYGKDSNGKSIFNSFVTKLVNNKIDEKFFIIKQYFTSDSSKFLDEVDKITSGELLLLDGCGCNIEKWELFDVEVVFLDAKTYYTEYTKGNSIEISTDIEVEWKITYKDYNYINYTKDLKGINNVCIN